MPHYQISNKLRSSLDKEEMRFFRSKFVEKSLPKATVLSSCYLTSIYLAIFSLYALYKQSENVFLTVIVNFFLLLLVVRQMRALENVVHFGSHGNFSVNKKVNDFLVNILAAWPMLSGVDEYRHFHNKHHGHYGKDIDPCKKRFENMGIGKIDLSTKAQIGYAVIRWMPDYIREYYRDIGSNSRQIMTFIS